jgi:hypothetical protein
MARSGRRGTHSRACWPPDRRFATGAGRIDIAALDDAGALIHRKFDGTSWSDWRHLGGELACIQLENGLRPDQISGVFARGKDGSLWTIVRTGETWSAWTSLGGTLTSAPAAVRDISGLHVYARGVDGAIASRSFTAGAWSPWVSHGDGIGSIPDRRRPAIYRLAADDVVFRGYDFSPR